MKEIRTRIWKIWSIEKNKESNKGIRLSQRKEAKREGEYKLDMKKNLSKSMNMNKNRRLVQKNQVKRESIFNSDQTI